MCAHVLTLDVQESTPCVNLWAGTSACINSAIFPSQNITRYAPRSNNMQRQHGQAQARHHHKSAAARRPDPPAPSGAAHAGDIVDAHSAGRAAAAAGTVACAQKSAPRRAAPAGGTYRTVFLAADTQDPAGPRRSRF